MPDDLEGSATPTCEQLIDMFPGPFVVIDRDYRILAANSAYRSHYGVGNRDVVGRFCHEVSHRSSEPCSGHGEHCPLERVFDSGQATHVMHVHFRADGSEEHVQIQTSPILGDDGAVHYVGEAIFPVIHADDALLIGRSRPMLRLTSLLQRVAPTATTVLLSGESGVGKERVAEYVHHYSDRAEHPFVVVDCGTLGENLIESELFGHERGAFTGASQRKEGLFEAAHGGTLFIDEIGELPLLLQTKLLRVLEAGKLRRLGGNDYRQVDVRVIAATNRDLKSMVAEGTFRQDLYYRLSAFPVTVPPLRERKDDIAALAHYFLGRQGNGARRSPLAPDVIERLLLHDYPGNVRELRNVMERAAILAGGQPMQPEHVVFDESGPERVPAERPAKSAGSVTPLINRGRRLDEATVLAALQRCDGHRARAARLLGVSERTIYRHVGRLRRGED